MTTISLDTILHRASEIRQAHATGSITPEDVGGLMNDIALYIQGLERNGSTLGIRKVYISLEEMQADNEPEDTAGRRLRHGNLVAIYNETTQETDVHSGMVYLYTASEWIPVARIGTAMRKDTTALEQRVTLIETDIREVIKAKAGQLEEQLATEVALRTRLLKGLSDRIDALEQERATTEALTQESESRIAEDARLAELITKERGLRAEAVSSLEGELEAERTKRSALAESLTELRSKGSGSGYYNVTSQHPLSTGYYTKETAVRAVASAGIPETERKGMIITFEVSPSRWVDYRYKGDSSDEQLSSVAMWELHTALRGVQVGTKLVEPIDGVVNLPELDVEVASSVDESDRPVSSRAVKGEIDSIKALTLDADTESTDEGTQVTLTQEGRQVVQFTVAGGGGGEATTTKAKVSAQLSATRIKLGSPVSRSYSYIHYSDGEQDGVPATLQLTIRRGVQVVVSESLGLKASGERGELDLSAYISSADSYSISITASYNEGDTAKTRTASTQLSVVDLSLSLYNRAEIESYLAGGGYKDGDTLSISLSVRGGAKAITMYLDGQEQETKTLTGVGSRQTFILPARSLHSGGHSLQFVAMLDEIKSNSIYLDILKAGANEPWVGLLFSHPLGTIYQTGATPILYASQYEQAEWYYIAT